MKTNTNPTGMGTTLAAGLIHRIPRGFSLIEVLLAMAIAVFSLLTILGLFSLGLQTNRDSRADTRAVFMVDNVRAMLLADEDFPINDTDALSTANNPSYQYFDDDGNLLYGTATNEHAYQCRITILDQYNTNSAYYLNEANYRSTRLDYIAMEFFNRGDTNKSFASFTFTRHRKNERPK